MTEAKKALHDIERTRAEMSATIGELEKRLNPAEIRNVVGAELDQVEARVREVIQEHLGEAKSLLEEELVDARKAVRGAMDDAESKIKSGVAEASEALETKIKTGLVEARDTVKKDVRAAVDGAKHAVRAATLGKVEELATQLGDTMNDTRETLVDTIRNNPLPAAVAGLGLAWLLMNRSKSARSGGRLDHGRAAADHDGWRMPGGGPNGARDTVERIGSSAQGAGRRAADTVGHFVHDASESANHMIHDLSEATSGAAHQATTAASGAVQQAATATGTAVHDASAAVSRIAMQTADAAGSLMHSAGETSSEIAHRAGDAASSIADGALAQARRVEQGLQSTLHSNPLAFGATALVVGAAVGFALPRTPIEDKFMGERRDTVMHRAEGAAHDVAVAVGHLGQKTAEAVKQSVSTATTPSST